MKIKKATASIVLYKYKTLANGDHPVKLRVTYEGVSRYFGLGVSAHPSNWNESTSRIIKDKHKYNLLLNQKDSLSQNILLDFDREGIDFTFSRFEDRFITTKSTKDVFNFLEDRIRELISENRLSSADSYRDLLYRLEDFKSPVDLSEKRRQFSLDKANGRNPVPYKRPSLTFHDMADLGFLESFVAFLAKRNSKTTQAIYLRTLKALINRAIRKELIRENMNPFKKYKIVAVKPGKVKSLTYEQMIALKAFDVQGQMKEDVDLFVLSYYMDGSNLKDIAKLKWKENVINGRLVFNRSKTEKPLDVEITEPMAEIITNYSKNSDYIFGILTDGLTEKQIRYRIKDRLKRINRNLKKAAAVLGLPEDITFYWARHSFAARLYNMGVSVQVISEMMTHGDLRVTKGYIGRLDKSHLDEVRKKNL